MADHRNRNQGDTDSTSRLDEDQFRGRADEEVNPYEEDSDDLVDEQDEDDDDDERTSF